MINVFITVRSKSTRLPNKCFLPFGKLTVVEHVMARAKHANLRPIICTTKNAEDKKIVELSKKHNIDYFCGSEINKLKRWNDCCLHYNLKSFHTVDADDPFFCGKEVKRSMKCLTSLSLDIVEPTIVSSKGSGIVGYSVKSDVFHRLSKKIKINTDTEMMWNFFKKLVNIKIKRLSKSKFDCNARLTLDYPEDYIFLESIRLLLVNLTSRKNICTLLKKNPNLTKINYFRNKEWKRNQIIKQN